MKLIELLRHAVGNSDYCLFVLYYELSLNGIQGLEVSAIRKSLVQARIRSARKMNISSVLDHCGSLVDFLNLNGNKRTWHLTNSGIASIEATLLKKMGFLPKIRKDVKSLLPQDNINILFLGLSPQNTTRIRLEKECREIDDKIRASNFRDVLIFHTKWAVQPQDLFQHINQIDPDIIHISGHGDALGNIAFEDQIGNAKMVNPEALVNAIAVTNRKTKTVLFNVCFSQTAAKLLANHIDCTIGMSDAIDDDSAILFAAGFYRALGFGKSVQQAYREAGAGLVLEGLSGFHLLNLNSRVGIDADQVIFASN